MMMRNHGNSFVSEEGKQIWSVDLRTWPLTKNKYTFRNNLDFGPCFSILFSIMLGLGTRNYDPDFLPPWIQDIALLLQPGCPKLTSVHDFAVTASVILFT